MGPTYLQVSLKEEGEAEETEVTVMLLPALMMEGGATRQGMQEASRSWTRYRIGFPPVALLISYFGPLISRL